MCHNSEIRQLGLPNADPRYQGNPRRRCGEALWERAANAQHRGAGVLRDFLEHRKAHYVGRDPEIVHEAVKRPVIPSCRHPDIRLLKRPRGATLATVALPGIAVERSEALRVGGPDEDGEVQETVRDVGSENCKVFVADPS